MSAIRFLRRRAAAFAVAAVGVFLGAPAAATSSTKISLPQGPASIEGLGRTFTPSLSSGTASYGLDIAVPPAAGGFVPKIALEYDAGGGVTEVGLGWRLAGLPSIRRRTTEGLPRFTDADTFEAVGLGLSSDLVEVSGGFFRPEHEGGAFVRVQRNGDGARWEARTKGGITYRFGGDGFTEREGNRVATYLLREQVDRHGHRIAYAWDTSEGHALLTSVTWNDFGERVRQQITLGYEDRPDAHELYSSGIRKTLSRRLASLEVTLGGELVRRYSLTYTEEALPQLAEVVLVGTDGQTAAPPLRFDYTQATFATSGQVVAMASAPGRTPADADVELADLDGDGLPDLLVTAAGAYRSYLNHDGKSWKAAVDWEPSESPSVSLDLEGTQLADLDGDGALDLVIKSGTDSFRYLPGSEATRFAPAIAIATVPSFSFEDPELRLVDLDGDRRTDVLLTSPAGLVVSYNLGGSDWSAPTTLGKVDAQQELSFSDGRTQLCDVNGDRIQDLCHLRSGALSYWLGRGRGTFAARRTAQGVPTFEASSPFRLVDLNGDGWVDLVHVGVTRVSYALAVRAGEFGAVREITGTPEHGPNVHVEFADLNGSGTVDILWVDVSGSAANAWRYLELFPQGRAGLLRTVDNGLGKITRITYEPASQSAAWARDEGTPWTTRMNVGMPVVSSVQVDSSLGDPLLMTRYRYLDGTWDPIERTFAGFGGGIQTELGDAFTPTLLTESRFDTGIERRTLRGAVLWSEQRDEAGRIFSRTHHEYESVSLGSSVSGRTLQYAYESSRRTEVVEGPTGSSPRTLLQEWAQDEFGNVVEERSWGEVVGSNLLFGEDEAIVQRTFANNGADWILGFVASEELIDAAGQRVAAKRNFYDGEPFRGLPLGQIARGDLTRQEEWVGPGEDAFELVTATRYNDDGQPVETEDGIGGGRVYTWDEDDHTTLLSETVKLDGDTELIEQAETDRRFGALLSVTEYNGQTSRYEYDPLGRLTNIYKPGDPGGEPSTRYTYMHGAPLSRVVTEVRLWPGRDQFERSESLFDGLGRARGTLTQDGELWVLAGVTLLDARGEAHRALRPRFVSEMDVADPPLLADHAGASSWRDALKREVRTLSHLGIETRTEYGALLVRRWDGGQTDPAAGYEQTPTVEQLDGLGRLVRVTRTLEGAELSAHFQYDAAGNLVGRTDPEGHLASYGYDGRGRRVLVDDPDLGRRTFLYDAAGNLIERRHPDGNVLKYAFDRAGRSVSEDWNGDGKPEVVHTWDAHPTAGASPLLRGKLAHTAEPSGSTEFEYDTRGRVTWTHLTIDGKRYSTGSLFDNLDREYLHIYPDKSSLRIHRNGRGQLAGYGEAIELHFDGDGVELERTFNTGVKQKLDYDADRRLTEIHALAADGSTLEHLVWDFDAAGNVTTLRDLRPDVPAEDDRTEAYTYDNLYRLRSAEGTWGKTTWEYSPSGNLLGRKSSVASQDVSSTAFGMDAGPHALTGFDGRSLKYDALGRLRSDGDRTYSWNGADQLVRVTGSSGAAVESTFDAEGRRRVRVETFADGKKSTTHFIDPWSEVKDGKLVRYIVHADRRIARLHESTGRPSAAPPVPQGEFVGPREREFFGFLGRLGALFAALWCVALVASGRARAALDLAVASVGRVVASLARRPASAAALACVALVASLPVLTACGSDGGKSAPSIEEGTIRTLSEKDTLLFHDQLGSLLTETSGTGKAKARFTAFPYGVARHQSSNESRLYANAPRDTGVGLDHMGARFYAPDLGVWTIGDPVLVNEPERVATAEFATASPYVYANLNPVVAADSDGNFWHIAVGAGVGALIGGGIEAARQYATNGKVEDWGRVGAAAAGGAVAGAVTAAVPTAGIAAVMAVGAGSGAAGGVTQRLVESGGKDAGTLKDVAVDAGVGALTGGLLKGGATLLKKLVPTKPATVPQAPKSGAPLPRDLHQEATVARDALAAQVASGRHPPATVVGAYSPSSGRVTAGASRGGGRGCAEAVCSEALGGAADIKFTTAVRPRTGKPVDVCSNCEGTFGRDAFPDAATRFASDAKNQ